jgi:hypothetical protein
VSLTRNEEEVVVSTDHKLWRLIKRVERKFLRFLYAEVFANTIRRTRDRVQQESETSPRSRLRDFTESNEKEKQEGWFAVANTFQDSGRGNRMSGPYVKRVMAHSEGDIR